MSFRPEPVPYTDDVSYIREWLGRQFNNLVGAFEVVDLVQLDELHIEPERAVVGMIRFADGTDWDPGNGRGLYVYDGTNWLQVIATTGGDLNAIEAIGTTGILTRTGSETWATRTITGTGNEIEVTNGNGVGGNPVIGIPTNPILTGETTLLNQAENAVVLTLATERPWSFLQALAGASAELILRSSTANKVFRIQDSAAANIASFQDGLMTANSLLHLDNNIRFPATQVASTNANTLDDYEEGAWTATLSFGGGSTGITYSNQSGRYFKIGRMVWIGARLTITNKGSSTGTAAIGGLPFTSTSIDRGACFVGHCGGMSGLTSAMQMLVSTSLSPRHQGVTGTGSLNDTHFTNSSDIIFGAVYETGS